MPNFDVPSVLVGFALGLAWSAVICAVKRALCHGEIAEAEVSFEPLPEVKFLRPAHAKFPDPGRETSTGA